jgi:hypothetical protein
MTDADTIVVELLSQYLPTLNKDLCRIVAQYFVYNSYKNKFEILREHVFNQPNCSICCREETHCDLPRCDRCFSFTCADNNHCMRVCRTCNSLLCLMCQCDYDSEFNFEIMIDCIICHTVRNKLPHELTREQSTIFVREYIVSGYYEHITSNNFEPELDLDGTTLKKYMRDNDPLKKYIANKTE